MWFGLFFRTRQLNSTCVGSVDLELFLHYSLIPSVSKGRGREGNWVTPIHRLPERPE